MAGLLDIFGALKAGREIADPTKWKNAANLGRLIAAVVSAGVALYRVFVGELIITDEQIIVISGAIATVIMVISNILSVITTRKNVTLTGLAAEDTATSKKVGES
jgi:hypothetical protein